MSGTLSRRTFAGLIPVALAAAIRPSSIRRGKPLPPVVGDFYRFLDPTTEAPVVRLTNPKTTSLLPAAQNRFVSSKNHFVILSSDRDGKLAPFQLDLRTGTLKRMADPQNLQAHSLCMDPKERLLYFLDDHVLNELALSNSKSRTIAEGISGFSAGNAPSEFLILREGRLEKLSGSQATTIADNVSPGGFASGCLVQPGEQGCAFWRGDPNGERELWYAAFPESGRKAKLVAKGPIADPFWSVPGDSLLFLRDVQSNVVLSELHEVNIDTGAEHRLAPTSQFAAFSPNADGSVFVGASRSKAQPNIVLLLRTPTREFTLCEHHSSNPAAVSPVFSPNSQRVYFQSDHDGKPAIYTVNVELLIEPTNG